MARVAMNESLSVVGAVAPRSAAKRIPGEAGIWIFIFGDMTVFALLFGAFVVTRAEDPDLFNHGAATLNQNFGAINTLLLLISSLLVVAGLRAIRRHRMVLAARCVAGAMACGAGFACVKVLEYQHEISSGFTPATNDFYTYFFVLTGLHFFHLAVGMCILAFILVQARRAKAMTPGTFAFVEGGTCFWHMVDLLWVVLFPLLYLMH
jgi:nitric oxide reductase NorE protein